MKKILSSWNLLSLKLKSKFILTIFLNLMSASLELIGIALIVPLLIFIINNGQLDASINFYQLNLLKKYILHENFKYLLFFVIAITFIIKNFFLIWLSKFQINLVEELRKNLSDKLINLYLNKSYLFHLKNNSSILLRNIFDEVINYCASISNFFLLITEIILFVTIISFLFFFNFKFTIYIFLLLVIILSIYYLAINKRLKIWSINLREYRGKLYKNIFQTFNSIKDIKMMSKEKYFFEKSKTYQDNAFKYENLILFVQTLPPKIFETITAIFIVLITFFLVKSNYEKNYIIVLLGLYTYSVFRLVPSVNRILGYLSIIRIKISSSEKIYTELTNTKNYLIKKDLFEQNNINKSEFKKLSLKNISFSYHKEKRPLFKNYNFEINKGDILGIHGPSGSGKTTFLNILCGLIEPDSGIIEFNNSKIDYKKFYWNSLIGYVPQNVSFIDGSFIENVTFGDSSFQNDQIKLVFNILGLTDLIASSPEKIHESIGQDGKRLSGGQKQRIGIARSLLLNPQILIMDESTNSLDKSSENQIFNGIVRLNKEIKVTLIVVSHDTNLLKKYCKTIIKI
jgi:ABC-type multidrug transport system fused ATPase/permease subunit